MELSSTAFKNGTPIPAQYTCDGPNISPPLQWSGVPDKTQALALLVDDPDAPKGNWVHWILFNIPPRATALPENIRKTRTIPNGARQGINDFRETGYGGPCPPGGTHRYFFRLFALDVELQLEPGTKRSELERNMTGHVLAEAQLMGTYHR
jgi:hypothetical protein